MPLLQRLSQMRGLRLELDTSDLALLVATTSRVLYEIILTQPGGAGEGNTVNKQQKPRYFQTKTGLYTTLHQTHMAKKANCERGTSGPIIKPSRMPEVAENGSGACTVPKATLGESEDLHDITEC